MINLIRVKKSIGFFLVFFMLFLLVIGLPSFFALSPFIYFSEVEGVNSSIVDANHFYINVYEFLVYQKQLDSAFTINEASHMHDVRILFNAFRFLSFIFLSLIFVYVYLIFKISNSKNKRRGNFSGKYVLVELSIFLKKLKYSIFISLGFFVFLLFFVLFNFSSSFTMFHFIFFPQGNWIFPFDSLLISLFPQYFFMGVAKKIFLLSLIVISSILVFVFFFEKKFLRKK